MPRTPAQSERFGVRPISMTGSPMPSASAAGEPAAKSPSRSTIPSCSSDSPSSRSEHSIPLLSTPRIFDFLSFVPVAGMTQPARANTPFMPVRALGAPHTTSKRSPPPTSTVQTRRRSALG